MACTNRFGWPGYRWSRGPDWATTGVIRPVTEVSGRVVITVHNFTGERAHQVLVDAVFADEAERTAVRGAARRLNVRFVGLFLVTDLATRLNRVGRREKDASDATPDIAGLQETYNIGPIDWAVIDASGTPEQSLKQCKSRITHGEAA